MLREKKERISCKNEGDEIAGVLCKYEKKLGAWKNSLIGIQNKK